MKWRHLHPDTCTLLCLHTNLNKARKLCGFEAVFSVKSVLESKISTVNICAPKRYKR